MTINAFYFFLAWVLIIWSANILVRRLGHMTHAAVTCLGFGIGGVALYVLVNYLALYLFKRPINLIPELLLVDLRLGTSLVLMSYSFLLAGVAIILKGRFRGRIRK